MTKNTVAYKCTLYYLSNCTFYQKKQYIPQKNIKSGDFIQRCFDLAQKANGQQSPNPMVGAVITRNNQIIGEGFHQKFGSNHAEINAILDATPLANFKDASIYVSLEPCFHVGKTPACVRTILEKQFKAVFISVRDINPLTAGQSIQLLKKNNTSVQESLLAQKGQQLLRHFATNINLQRPYIILKYATSKDGFVGQKNKSVWLSNAFSKRLTHLWRSKLDAILVGGNTVRIDNPQLNTRYFQKKNPLRVVLTNSGNIPYHSHVLDDQSPTLVATLNHKLFLPESNADIVKLNPTQNYLTDLMQLLLAKKNVGTIMIEGGAKTLQSFIDADLWDEARIFQTPVNLKKGIPQPRLKNHYLAQEFQLDTDLVQIYQHRRQLDLENYQ